MMKSRALSIVLLVIALILAVSNTPCESSQIVEGEHVILEGELDRFGGSDYKDFRGPRKFKLEFDLKDAAEVEGSASMQRVPHAYEMVSTTCFLISVEMTFTAKLDKALKKDEEAAALEVHDPTKVYKWGSFLNGKVTITETWNPTKPDDEACVKQAAAIGIKPGTKNSQTVSWEGQILTDGTVFGNINTSGILPNVFKTKIAKISQKKPEDKQATIISGRATVDHRTLPAIPDKLGGNSLSYAKITLEHRERPGERWTEIETKYTTLNGAFDFNITKSNNNQEYALKLSLQDNYQGREYIQIIDKSSPSISDRWQPVWVRKTFAIEEGEIGGTKKVDLKLTELTSHKLTSSSKAELIFFMALKYLYFQQAVRYAVSELRADISTVEGKKVIPLKIYVMSKHREGTHYDRDGAIHIASSQSKLLPTEDGESPYAEFHEFGHHCMYSQFIPISEEITPEFELHANHDGFTNPTTADSLSEGNPTFYALLVADHYGYNKREPMYMNMGLEGAWRPWEIVGDQHMEEYAITALLWDLYDARNCPLRDAGKDNVSLKLVDIWEIISNENRTVLDVYEALRKKYNNNKILLKDIDALFVLNGLFVDMKRGDGKYNGPRPSAHFKGEPWRYMPSKMAEKYPYNPLYDAAPSGEMRKHYEDLGSGHEKPSGQEYTEGIDRIGTASNYRRPNRKFTPKLRNSHILIKNKEINSFVIRVQFGPEPSSADYEFETLARGGMVYIRFPSPMYQTTLTVIPKSENYMAESPLVIDSITYYDEIEKSIGQTHFLEHEFNLIPVDPATKRKKTGIDSFPSTGTNATDTTGQQRPTTPPDELDVPAGPVAKLPPDKIQAHESPTKPKPYEGQLPLTPFPQREVIQEFDNGNINWSEGTITALGIGAPPPNAINMAQARAMARRAAIVVARRNLLELLQGVQIDSMTLVKEAIVQSDIMRTSIQGVVRNAQIIDTAYLSDGSVEVKVAMNMSGQLANTILPQHSPAVPWATGPSVATATSKTLKSSSDIITGLVVDARGLGARPAMSPKIVDEKGKEIYGSAMVNRQYAVQQGMAGYSRDLSAAQGNSRVTANPLTVKGLRSVGPGKSDIVISNSDATRILSAAENLLFMQKCLVMIVLD